MSFPLFLKQFLDSECLLCMDEVGPLAEPTTLVLSDTEMVHGLVCQRCIAAHSHTDMHAFDHGHVVHAFEQWQGAAC